MGIDGKSVSTTSSFSKETLLMNLNFGENSSIIQVLESEDVRKVLQIRGSVYNVDVRTEAEQKEYDAIPKPPKVDKTKLLKSPMPGTLVSLKVKVGQQVQAGEEVAIIEAMKMQNILKAPKEGVVKSVNVEESTMLSADELIYELE